MRKMAKLKKPLLFALALLPISVIAGIFIGFYQLDTLSPEMIDEVVAELGSTDLLVVIGAVQTVGYALICGFFGYILADKIGLIKPFKPEKSKLLVTFSLSLIGGVVFSLDYWVFGNLIDGIKEADAAGLTPEGVIASVLYGGVIEEVLLRLFLMSIIAFILWKIFARDYDRDSIPAWVFITANIVAATLFAAGHLPATLAIFGELSPLLLFRCFLLNGGFGLIFGWLYRKYGIVYAMISHALFHIVSKLIWIVFI